jgi:hypothetical protein
MAQSDIVEGLRLSMMAARAAERANHAIAQYRLTRNPEWALEANYWGEATIRADFEARALLGGEG